MCFVFQKIHSQEGAACKLPLLPNVVSCQQADGSGGGVDHLPRASGIIVFTRQEVIIRRHFFRADCRLR